MKLIFISGPSGSGKSDLALRLLEAGGVLIGDDRIALSVRDDFVVARVPETSPTPDSEHTGSPHRPRPSSGFGKAVT